MFISCYLFNRQADMIRKYTTGFNALCQEDNVQFYFEGKHQSCTSSTERTERSLFVSLCSFVANAPIKNAEKKKNDSIHNYQASTPWQTS